MSRTARLRPYYRRRAQRGVSIIEVLVASVIISVAVGGLVATWAHMVTGTLRTDNTAAAYQCARMVLERARSNGFNGYSDINNFPVAMSAAPNGATSPSVRRFRYFNGALTEIGGGDGENPPTVPTGAALLATTSVFISPANEVPTGRLDLRVITLRVDVRRVDAQGAIVDEILATTRTILTQGGI